MNALAYAFVYAVNIIVHNVHTMLRIYDRPAVVEAFLYAYGASKSRNGSHTRKMKCISADQIFNVIV